MFFLNQLQQLALAHHGVVQVQPCEFALLRTDFHAVVFAQQPHFVHAVDHPVVQGTVNLELKRTHGVRDAFERVFNRVREIVHRINAPLVPFVVMRNVADTVDDGIAEMDVGRGHVNLRANAPFPVGELASLHPVEDVQVPFGRCVA